MQFREISTALSTPRPANGKGAATRRMAALAPLCILALLTACGGDTGGGAGPVVVGPPPLSIDTSNSTTAAYGVLGTASIRVAFVPSPGGVMPFLLENTSTQTVT